MPHVAALPCWDGSGWARRGLSLWHFGNKESPATLPPIYTTVAGGLCLSRLSIGTLDTQPDASATVEFVIAHVCTIRFAQAPVSVRIPCELISCAMTTA